MPEAARAERRLSWARAGRRWRAGAGRSRPRGVGGWWVGVGVAEGTMAVCSSDQLFRSDQGSIRGQGEPMVCDLGLFFAARTSKWG